MDAVDLQRDLALNAEDAEAAAHRVLDHLANGEINLQVLLFLVVSQMYPDDAVEEAVVDPDVCDRIGTVLAGLPAGGDA
jgi:hypothetical protein